MSYRAVWYVRASSVECGVRLTESIWPLERSWLTVLATDGFSATFSTRGISTRAEWSTANRQCRSHSRSHRQGGGMVDR